jgi:hypothetical protein
MTKDGNLNYSNELRNIWRTQGIRGLYRGFWAFAWRDIPGWAVYFAAFEQLKIMNESLISSMECDEQTRQRRSNLLALNAGGLAGQISWLVCIPQDIVKNKQQTHTADQPLRMREALDQIKAEGGYRKLFKGACPILIRAYIVSAITLPLYDVIKDNCPDVCKN